MADAARVLVVDDDAAVAEGLVMLLTLDGFEATVVNSAEQALAVLEKRPFDAIISDQRMPGASGVELLKLVKERSPELPFIILTAYADVKLAVEAMREGAADFLEKPAKREELIFVLRKALEGTAAARAAPPRPSRAKVETTDGMVGTSSLLEEARATIRKVAPTMSTVLVLGETGTGKELAARAVHSLSNRKAKPFVTVNCGAFTETLLESELFGHEKDAFTGANARKPGRVELADGGTLFLDEVGELSPAAQVRLLRVLQEKEVQRVGGTAPIKVDVRFVAATHRDLPAMVKEGKFREDLLFRLNVIPVSMPALRRRPEDIEPLAKHFLSVLGPQNGRPKAAFTTGALALISSQSWTGNVRQLQNFIERLTVLAPDGDLIDENAVKRELARLGTDSVEAPTANGDSLPERRKDAERQAVEEALKKAKGNRALAARLLGVSRRTLYNKLDSLGLAEA